LKYRGFSVQVQAGLEKILKINVFILNIKGGLNRTV